MNLHHSKQGDKKMATEESKLKKTMINMKGIFSILYVLTNVSLQSNGNFCRLN